MDTCINWDHLFTEAGATITMLLHVTPPQLVCVCLCGIIPAVFHVHQRKYMNIFKGATCQNLDEFGLQKRKQKANTSYTCFHITLIKVGIELTLKSSIWPSRLSKFAGNARKVNGIKNNLPFANTNSLQTSSIFIHLCCPFDIVIFHVNSPSMTSIPVAAGFRSTPTGAPTTWMGMHPEASWSKDTHWAKTAPAQRSFMLSVYSVCLSLSIYLHIIQKETAHNLPSVSFIHINPQLRSDANM